jgi:hypothetical protein
MNPKKKLRKVKENHEFYQMYLHRYNYKPPQKQPQKHLAVQKQISITKAEKDTEKSSGFFGMFKKKENLLSFQICELIVTASL